MEYIGVGFRLDLAFGAYRVGKYEGKAKGKAIDDERKNARIWIMILNKYKGSWKS